MAAEVVRRAVEADILTAEGVVTPVAVEAAIPVVVEADTPAVAATRVVGTANPHPEFRLLQVTGCCKPK
jgi:hypothetical protein